MDFHVLGKPILLFFLAGFVCALFRAHMKKVEDFHPYVTYLLLLSIGWHGGEELAMLSGHDLWQALGLMPLGFVTNTIIALISYQVLKGAIRLPKLQAATIAGYYGSDSAGTFATCIAFLGAFQISYAPWMSALLAVMEIPGCIVFLLLVHHLRHEEEEKQRAVSCRTRTLRPAYAHVGGSSDDLAEPETMSWAEGGSYDLHPEVDQPQVRKKSIWSGIKKILQEEEICLLLGGMLLGLASRIQGNSVTADLDHFFVQGQTVILALFLLGIGYKAAKTLRGEKVEGSQKKGRRFQWRLVTFALVAPNVFAMLGLGVIHGYSWVIGHPFEVGTYALFAALCAPASYIAMSAIHQSVIRPEEKFPVTVPILMSLGVTFTYNVLFGLQLYIGAAKMLLQNFPVV